MFETFRALRGWVEGVRGVTGLRRGKYADVSNAAALRDLSKMYITYVPGLQDYDPAKE